MKKKPTRKSALGIDRVVIAMSDGSQYEFSMLSASFSIDVDFVSRNAGGFVEHTGLPSGRLAVQGKYLSSQRVAPGVALAPVQKAAPKKRR